MPELVTQYSISIHGHLKRQLLFIVFAKFPQHRSAFQAGGGHDFARIDMFTFRLKQQGSLSGVTFSWFDVNRFLKNCFALAQREIKLFQRIHIITLLE